VFSVLIETCDAPVELGSLRVRHGYVLVFKALPEALDQIEPLARRESSQLGRKIAHVVQNGARERVRQFASPRRATSKTIAVGGMPGGMNVHYHDVGEGEPVLFLHSYGPGTTAWITFHKTVDALSQHFRCVLISSIARGCTPSRRGPRSHCWTSSASRGRTGSAIRRAGSRRWWRRSPTPRGSAARRLQIRPPGADRSILRRLRLPRAALNYRTRRRPALRKSRRQAA